MITQQRHRSRAGIVALLLTGMWSTGALAQPQAQAPGGTPAAAVGGMAGTQQAGGANGRLAPADLEVLKTLHATNQVEMRVGKIAKDRAASDAVKSFAQKVVADHTKEEKKLTVFLKKRGMRIAALGPVPSDIPAEHLAYKGKTGAAYDHAFAGQMAADYQKAIDLVERQLKSTTDDSVRALLDQRLPTLRVLLATAEVLDKD